MQITMFCGVACHFWQISTCRNFLVKGLRYKGHVRVVSGLLNLHGGSMFKAWSCGGAGCAAFSERPAILPAKESLPL
jgi:hypothetical protein